MLSTVMANVTTKCASCFQTTLHNDRQKSQPSGIYNPHAL